MKINFVCRANIWRSRVAEAYAKSLITNDKNLEVCSSGIEAEKDFDGPVNPYTKKALENDGLWQYAHPEWRQTTQQMIDESDLVVFMNQDVADDARKFFKIPNQKIVTWRIPDLDESYEDIKVHVKQLISRCQ